MTYEFPHKKHILVNKIVVKEQKSSFFANTITCENAKTPTKWHYYITIYGPILFSSCGTWVLKVSKNRHL